MEDVIASTTGIFVVVVVVIVIIERCFFFLCITGFPAELVQLVSVHIYSPPSVKTNPKACVIWDPEGSYTVHGHHQHYGDIGSISSVHSTRNEFAFKKPEGIVISCGGMLSMYHVDDIVSTRSHFAALHTTGSITMWNKNGVVKVWTSKFKSIHASATTLVAIKEDGGLLVWGSGSTVTDFPRVKHLLHGQVVKTIQSTPFQFLARLGDGSVVTWGACTITDKLSKDVKNIYTDGCNFSVLCLYHDGQAVIEYSNSPPKTFDKVASVFTVDCGYILVHTDKSAVAINLMCETKYTNVSAVHPLGDVALIQEEDGTIRIWDTVKTEDAKETKKITPLQGKTLDKVVTTQHPIRAALFNGSVFVWSPCCNKTWQFSHVHDIHANDMHLIVVFKNGNVMVHEKNKWTTLDCGECDIRMAEQ